jgi:hypothetical protein
MIACRGDLGKAARVFAGRSHEDQLERLDKIFDAKAKDYGDSRERGPPGRWTGIVSNHH